MLGIAQFEKDLANDVLEKRLWNAVDQFRVNSGLTAAQYSGKRPVRDKPFCLAQGEIGPACGCVLVTFSDMTRGSSSFNHPCSSQ